MGHVTMDSQRLPPGFLWRVADAEDRRHPTKAVARVSTLATAKSGGNEWKSNPPRTPQQRPQTILDASHTLTAQFDIKPRQIRLKLRPVFDAAWRLVRDRRTYLRIFYLLLAFPLGTLYFVVIVTGLSTGVGLAIVMIGFPILLVTLLGWLLSRRVRTGYMSFQSRLIPSQVAPELFKCRSALRDAPDGPDQPYPRNSGQPPEHPRRQVVLDGQ